MCVASGSDTDVVEVMELSTGIHYTLSLAHVLIKYMRDSVRHLDNYCLVLKCSVLRTCISLLLFRLEY